MLCESASFPTMHVIAEQSRFFCVQTMGILGILDPCAFHMEEDPEQEASEKPYNGYFMIIISPE